jgi:post-segregation antitoxin (ccd killing protein)
LTPKEDKALTKQAKTAGLNVSQYIRFRLADDLEQAA